MSAELPAGGAGGRGRRLGNSQVLLLASHPQGRCQGRHGDPGDSTSEQKRTNSLPRIRTGLLAASPLTPSSLQGQQGRAGRFLSRKGGGRAGPHTDDPGRGYQGLYTNKEIEASAPGGRGVGGTGQCKRCTPPARPRESAAPGSGLLTRQPAGGVVASARGVSRGSQAQRACSIGQLSGRGGRGSAQ